MSYAKVTSANCFLVYVLGTTQLVLLARASSYVCVFQRLWLGMAFSSFLIRSEPFRATRFCKPLVQFEELCRMFFAQIDNSRCSCTVLLSSTTT